MSVCVCPTPSLTNRNAFCSVLFSPLLPPSLLKDELRRCQNQLGIIRFATISTRTLYSRHWQCMPYCTTSLRPRAATLLCTSCSLGTRCRTPRNRASPSFSSEVRGAIVSTAAFAAMRAALLDLLAPHPVRVMFFELHELLK